MPHIATVKASNDPIHRNARLVVERGVPMIVRIPLIPGLTDTDENIEAIASSWKISTLNSLSTSCPTTEWGWVSTRCWIGNTRWPT